jgi:FtsH-binding integral membrane protein
MTWNPNPASPTQTGAGAQTSWQAASLTQSFVWMFAGLLLTAGVAVLVQGSPQLIEFARANFLLLLIAQFGVVLLINFGINRIGATPALGLFFIYAASLGLTVGLIVRAYTGVSVASAFLSAAAMFGGAGLYGATTKRSLASLGGILVTGVIGLIAASLVNVFLGSSTIGLIISIVGVVIFTVLTAFHVQRIQSGELAAALGSQEKAAVIGALALYLDFVNIFLFLLRILGNRE